MHVHTHIYHINVCVHRYASKKQQLERRRRKWTSGRSSRKAGSGVTAVSWSEVASTLKAHKKPRESKSGFGNANPLL